MIRFSRIAEKIRPIEVVNRFVPKSCESLFSSNIKTRLERTPIFETLEHSAERLFDPMSTRENISNIAKKAINKENFLARILARFKHSPKPSVTEKITSKIGNENVSVIKGFTEHTTKAEDSGLLTKIHKLVKRFSHKKTVEPTKLISDGSTDIVKQSKYKLFVKDLAGKKVKKIKLKSRQAEKVKQRLAANASNIKGSVKTEQKNFYNVFERGTKKTNSIISRIKKVARNNITQTHSPTKMRRIPKSKVFGKNSGHIAKRKMTSDFMTNSSRDVGKRVLQQSSTKRINVKPSIQQSGAKKINIEHQIQREHSARNNGHGVTINRQVLSENAVEQTSKTQQNNIGCANPFTSPEMRGGKKATTLVKNKQQTIINGPVHEVVEDTSRKSKNVFKVGDINECADTRIGNLFKTKPEEAIVTNPIQARETIVSSTQKIDSFKMYESEYGAKAFNKYAKEYGLTKALLQIFNEGGSITEESLNIALDKFKFNPQIQETILLNAKVDMFPLLLKMASDTTVKKLKGTTFSNFYQTKLLSDRVKTIERKETSLKKFVDVAQSLRQCG